MKKGIIVGVIVAAVIVSIIVSIANNDTSINESTDATGSKQSPSNLITKDTPLKGDLSAPVLLIEFGDFQCPNCGRFARETAPLIEEAYINSGQVSMAFKHFTIIGPDSKTAAMASQCANDQAKFWEFHDELYQNQGPENSGWAKTDNLKKVASKIGLDRQIFDSCLDSNKYKSLVENDLNIAVNQIKFKGTPSFLILKNDGSLPETLTGAYPFATFQKILDEKLSG